MNYIKQHFENTLEVKQSKFIAHLVPFTIYEQTLQHLKQQHPKARHFVTAFRYLNEFEQIVESSSDDGEPKGTSGKPSLMVLQGKEIINTAVIVVRYFGGTKLGTGGLVRAYSDAVNLVLESAEVFEYKTQQYETVTFEYADVRFIEYECEQFDIEIADKLFDTKAIYKLKSSKENMEKFLKRVERVVKNN